MKGLRHYKPSSSYVIVPDTTIAADGAAARDTMNPVPGATKIRSSGAGIQKKPFKNCHTSACRVVSVPADAGVVSFI
jgi:hypothetical protein